MLEILFSVLLFTAILALLALLILWIRAKLIPPGGVTILVNKYQNFSCVVINNTKEVSIDIRFRTGTFISRFISILSSYKKGNFGLRKLVATDSLNNPCTRKLNKIDRTYRRL